MKLNIQANIPQSTFLAMPHKFKLFCAGYGSGKTYVGCMAICRHFWELPCINQGYFAPTYTTIEDVFYPTIEEVAHNFGLNVKIKIGKHEVHVYNGRVFRGVVKCRSLNDPSTIVGFKIGHALMDELDTLPLDKAKDAWQKTIARMRYKVPGVRNGIDITTTPEGFRFCHHKFVHMVAEKPELANNYGIIHASTYDNEVNLNDDYIPSLFESYPKELIKSYIRGQFTNLTSGTVYSNYSRKRCRSKEKIQPRETLLIGQDFNVGHMASTVFVRRATGMHAVAELKDLLDTPATISIIKEKWESQGHHIIMYPDATGKNRESVGACTNDIALMRNAGFEIRAKLTNPAVKDRILSTNKAFADGKVWVNDRECPTVARCLEQQAYDKNGAPDKKGGFDHQNDAFSYPTAWEYPIIKPLHRIGIKGF